MKDSPVSRQLAVIFDMDGVLVDSYRAHFASWLALARECGFEFTERQFAATFGRTSRDIIANLWPDPPPDERIAEMDDRKEALYREIISKDFPAMDGARELIRALHAAGFKLAVGSSGPPENVAVALDGRQPRPHGLGRPDRHRPAPEARPRPPRRGFSRRAPAGPPRRAHQGAWRLVVVLQFRYCEFGCHGGRRLPPC